MRLYVGITDPDWFRFLSSRPEIDEVNFWQPSGRVSFRALQPGELFLFKLHAPENFIVGGGLFAHWSPLPVSLAWQAFEEKNGAQSLQEMRTRLAQYRDVADDPRGDYTIGCILLEQPFFFARHEWIPSPRDWKGGIQRGKGYDTTTGEGRRLWEQVIDAMPSAGAGTLPDSPYVPQAVFETRSKKATLVYPRLGQGSFRVLVRDVYDRRCAVTGERTLPALEAAHIRSVEQGGPHDPRNGLLLRRDLHALFDQGYVTVNPDLVLQVSKRIREEFENGRDYYALDGRPVATPTNPAYRPSSSYLDWHASHVYRG